MNDSIQRYNKTAIILHWVIGLLIIAMFALGFWMHELPKELKVDSLDLFNLGIHTIIFQEPTSLRTFYFNLHKSIGVTLLALILFRVYWRISHPAPAYPSNISARDKKVAGITHKLLYALMLAMPLSGVAMAVNSKYGIKWFGMDLIAGLDNAAMRDVFKEAHEIIGTILLVLIVLHVAAAIKHKVFDKDDIMKRMSMH